MNFEIYPNEKIGRKMHKSMPCFKNSDKVVLSTSESHRCSIYYLILNNCYS